MPSEILEKRLSRVGNTFFFNKKRVFPKSSSKLERCGTGKGYLNEAQSGSFRPSGLRIKRAET
jgi:hypothetical protein